jgi:hypothetical protein
MLRRSLAAAHLGNRDRSSSVLFVSSFSILPVQVGFSRACLHYTHQDEVRNESGLGGFETVEEISNKTFDASRRLSELSVH